MRSALFGILCWLICFPVPAFADGYACTSAETEVRRDFEEALDLWRDGRLEELYDRTYSSGKPSRETFVRKLSDTGVRPACCWEKMQEVSISVSDAGKAELRARVGLENGGTATEYSTRTFRLRKKDGVWKASASDILSLAGKASGKVRRP